MTIGPSETVEAKGVPKKTPNHYRRVNVVIDDIAEGQHCGDITIVHHLKMIPVIL